MIKRYIAAILAAAMLLSCTACGKTAEDAGSQPNAASQTEAVSRAEETSREEELTGDIAFSADAIPDFDDKLAEIAKAKGVDVHYNEEDGEYKDKIAFTTSAKTAKEIASEYAAWLSTNFVEDEASTIKEIIISDKYDSVEFRVSSKFRDSLDMLFIVFFFSPMSELQVLTGKDEKAISYEQKIVDADTGEVISDAMMPDALGESSAEEE